jgi:hypothetical protein
VIQDRYDGNLEGIGSERSYHEGRIEGICRVADFEEYWGAEMYWGGKIDWRLDMRYSLGIRWKSFGKSMLIGNWKLFCDSKTIGEKYQERYRLTIFIAQIRRDLTI